MTSLKKWLRGLGMSQFSPRAYSGFKVITTPNDWLRRWLIVPLLYLELLPYFSGADIVFDVKMIRQRNDKLKPFNYKWNLYKKGSENAERSGSGANTKPSKVFRTKLHIGHFSYTDEYRLDLTIEQNGSTESHTVADFEITSRADMLLNGWWLIIGGVAGYLIGKFA
jgi:hypothetical protein